MKNRKLVPKTGVDVSSSADADVAQPPRSVVVLYFSRVHFLHTGKSSAERV